MSAHDSLAMTSPSVRSCRGRSRAVPARLALCNVSARPSARTGAKTQTVNLWFEPAGKGKTPPRFLCQLPSGLARLHAGDYSAYMHGKMQRTCASHTHTSTQPSLSAQAVCDSSLALCLSVGVICWCSGGINTVMSKQQQNVPKIHFVVSHSLSVWLLTAAMCLG